MWIERSDTLIHALGHNTTLFAGQSEGWYVLILVPKKTRGLGDIQCGIAERCQGLQEIISEGLALSSSRMVCLLVALSTVTSMVK